MKIVYDQNIPHANAFFAGLGELIACDGRQLSAADVADADVLLVRSVTPVNAALLADSSVRFVASATIGTDHVDQQWLQQAGVRFANAPGCNADSVADYVVGALLMLAAGDLEALRQRRAGVIGVGNVGSRVAARLEALGIDCLCCDPPRAEREGHLGFVELDQLLARCDLICAHTPLIEEGKHPTYHLLGETQLRALRSNCWLLNAGRGAVVDNAALLDVLQERDDLRVVLDVWEPEPGLDPRLMQRVTLATPHIAGYSDEGRSRGTEMIYRALCTHLGITPTRRLAELLPPGPHYDAGRGGTLAAAVQHCYDICADDRVFRQMVQEGGLPAGFDRLRRDYPGRREFSSCHVTSVEPDSELALLLRGLGFRLD